MEFGDGKPGRTLTPGVRSILVNGAFLLGSSWVSTGIRAAYVVILARALGPAGYGLISTTQALYLMLVLTVVTGVPAFLSRELAADRARGEETISVTLLIQVASLSLGAGIFFLVGMFTEVEPAARQVFFLFAGALLARGLAMWARHVFVVLEASHYHLRQVTLFRTGEVLIAAMALAMGAGIFAIAAIHLVSWILEAALSLLLIHRSLATLSFRPHGWLRHVTVARGVLTASAAVAAGEWLRMAPLAMYRYIADEASDVGQFAFAWNASLVLAVALVTAMNAAYPVASRAQARSDGKDAYYLDFCIRGGVILGAAAVIAGLAIGPWALTLAAGAEYASAGVVFVATLTILGPTVMNYALDQTLLLQDRTQLVLLLNAGALPVVAGAFIFAHQSSGPTAATLAVFAVLATLAVVKVVIFKPVAGIVLLPSLMRSCAAAATGLVIAVPLIAFSPWGGLAGIAALTLAAFVSKTVTPRERGILMSLVGR